MTFLNARGLVIHVSSVIVMHCT